MEQQPVRQGHKLVWHYPHPDGTPPLFADQIKKEGCAAMPLAT